MRPHLTSSLQQQTSFSTDPTWASWTAWTLTRVGCRLHRWLHQLGQLKFLCAARRRSGEEAACTRPTRLQRNSSTRFIAGLHDCVQGRLFTPLSLDKAIKCELESDGTDDPNDPLVRDFWVTVAAYEQLLSEKNESAPLPPAHGRRCQRTAYWLRCKVGRESASQPWASSCSLWLGNGS
jgi:hypothetical protein